jgi:hypothetical protein
MERTVQFSHPMDVAHRAAARIGPLPAGNAADDAVGLPPEEAEARIETR